MTKEEIKVGQKVEELWNPEKGIGEITKTLKTVVKVVF